MEIHHLKQCHIKAALFINSNLSLIIKLILESKCDRAALLWTNWTKPMTNSRFNAFKMLAICIISKELLSYSPRTPPTDLWLWTTKQKQTQLNKMHLRCRSYERKFFQKVFRATYVPLIVPEVLNDRVPMLCKDVKISNIVCEYASQIVCMAPSTLIL